MNKAEIDNGTIFYIIIAIIAAISSVLQKKKKPETHIPEPEPYEETTRPWKDFGEETIERQAPQPAYTPVVIPPIVKAEGKKNENQYEMGNAWVNHQSEAPAYDDNDIKMGEIGSLDEAKKSSKIDFELRQAVIYSEILNKKY